MLHSRANGILNWKKHQKHFQGLLLKSLDLQFQSLIKYQVSFNLKRYISDTVLG